MIMVCKIATTSLLLHLLILMQMKCHH